MEYRPLGPTGIRISAIAFGAGPVPALLTKPGQEERQLETIRRALDAGINWFDTAATYGEGRSEAALGAALHSLGATGQVHVATKVRLLPDQLGDIAAAVRESFTGSLARLRVERVTLLQVHNSLTQRRGDLATSITPRDVLGPGGILEAFEQLRREGRVAHLGLTGLGDPGSLIEVLESGAFAAIQLPYNLLLSRLKGGRLTPAAARPQGASTRHGAEIDDGPVLEACRRLGVGVLAIRVMAGGALALQPPSDYTRQTKFFPLELYERDLRRATALPALLPVGTTLAQSAVRFVLGRPGIAAALIGFSDAGQVDEAVRCASAGPLAHADSLRLLAAEA